MRTWCAFGTITRFTARTYVVHRRKNAQCSGVIIDVGDSLSAWVLARGACGSMLRPSAPDKTMARRDTSRSNPNVALLLLTLMLVARCCAEYVCFLSVPACVPALCCQIPCVFDRHIALFPRCLSFLLRPLSAPRLPTETHGTVPDWHPNLPGGKG